MPVPAAIRPGATEERRIIRATGYRCELCGDEWPARHLDIHFIPRSRVAPPRREDLHRWILVLCPRCHRDLHRHRCTLRDQASLVSLRDIRVSREIHRLLSSPPPPYAAPDTFDRERFFLDPSPVSWGWVV
jgi:hypothetical protein